MSLRPAQSEFAHRDGNISDADRIRSVDLASILARKGVRGRSGDRSGGTHPKRSRSAASALPHRAFDAAVSRR